jgi:hypothetical protein
MDLSLVKISAALSQRAVNARAKIMPLVLCTSSTQDEKLMQAARLPCRPVRALHSFENRLAVPQNGTPAAASLNISSTGLPLFLPRPYRPVIQVAWLRTRAPAEQYSVPRRVTFPHAAPQFLRKWARPTGPGPFTPPDRVEMPTEVLEKELMWIAEKKPFLPRIEEILHILIEQRHIRPKVSYYQALILGNSDLARGSVANVERILQDMKEEGVPIGASIYNAVLKVRLPATELGIVRG